MNQDLLILASSVLVLAVMAVLWLRRRAKFRRARNWPMTAGRVESAGVTLESGGGQPGSAAHYAELKYSYQARGQTYRGSMRRRFLLKGAADKWIARFANGTPLTVRYDPSKVHDSVLLEVDHPAPAPRSVSARLSQ